MKFCVSLCGFVLFGLDTVIFDKKKINYWILLQFHQ